MWGYRSSLWRPRASAATAAVERLRRKGGARARACVSVRRAGSSSCRCFARPSRGQRRIGAAGPHIHSARARGPRSLLCPKKEGRGATVCPLLSLTRKLVGPAATRRRFCTGLSVHPAMDSSCAARAPVARHAAAASAAARRRTIPQVRPLCVSLSSSLLRPRTRVRDRGKCFGSWRRRGKERGAGKGRCERDGANQMCAFRQFCRRGVAVKKEGARSCRTSVCGRRPRFPLLPSLSLSCSIALCL